MATEKEPEYTPFEKMVNAAENDGFEAAFPIGTPVPSKRGPAFQWQVITDNELEQGGDMVMKAHVNDPASTWSLTLWSKDLRFMLRVREEGNEEWEKVNDGHGLDELKAALNDSAARDEWPYDKEQE